MNFLSFGGPFSASSQVKFLTQEEEEARAVFGKKAAVLMEEISYLRENLSAERAALEAARAEGGHSSEQERQRYNRYVKELVLVLLIHHRKTCCI